MVSKQDGRQIKKKKKKYLILVKYLIKVIVNQSTN